MPYLDQLTHDYCTPEGCKRMNILERESCPAKEGGLSCDSCGAEEDEDVEIITGRGGDEIGYICEGCHDRMFA